MMREDFWDPFLVKLNKKVYPKFNPPRKKHVIYAASGKTGVKWSITVKLHESWVELEIWFRDKKDSHRIYDWFYKYRNEIESNYGSKLIWSKKENRNACRIQTKPHEDFGYNNQEKWDELQDILIEKLIRMYHALSPYIKKLWDN